MSEQAKNLLIGGAAALVIMVALSFLGNRVTPAPRPNPHVARLVRCPYCLRTIAIDPDTGSIGTPPTSTVPTK